MPTKKQVIIAKAKRLEKTCEANGVPSGIASDMAMAQLTVKEIMIVYDQNKATATVTLKAYRTLSKDYSKKHSYDPL